MSTVLTLEESVIELCLLSDNTIEIIDIAKEILKNQALLRVLQYGWIGCWWPITYMRREFGVREWTGPALVGLNPKSINVFLVLSIPYIAYRTYLLSELS